ncbi:serine/threonine-protein kinase [Erysipelothrix urinaevulpis]|uniref:serine/threonine-protein kinase n=1 Tax=Erysipelothrix urinaevulpis TaxID=2683717 RepID=UPI00135C1FCB|nr:serine/threonine-protein kinase [Erysipelothrix urinaevulpis]
MKNNTKQAKTLIKENYAKKIYLIETDSFKHVVKEYYQHDNENIYQILLKYSHPNIVPIYKVDRDETKIIVHEKYIGDITLSDILPINNHDMLLNVLLQICDGLLFLHSHEIIHRDLKPDNIYYLNGNVIINDFDIAKIDENKHRNKDTHMFGSVGFAAPEQYGFSRTDERSDIYSFGALAQYLMTGDQNQPISKKNPLKPIVDRCMEINPDERYGDVNELKLDLERIKLGKSQYALPGFRRGIKKNKIIASIVYIIFILLVLVAEDGSEGNGPKNHLSAKIGFAFLMLPFLFIPTNYLNVHRFAPRNIKKHKFITNFMLIGMYYFLVFVILMFLSPFL